MSKTIITLTGPSAAGGAIRVELDYDDATTDTIGNEIVHLATHYGLTDGDTIAITTED